MIVSANGEKWLAPLTDLLAALEEEGWDRVGSDTWQEPHRDAESQSACYTGLRDRLARVSSENVDAASKNRQGFNFMFQPHADNPSRWSMDYRFWTDSFHRPE